jgi:hypothetical protein
MDRFVTVRRRHSPDRPGGLDTRANSGSLSSGGWGGHGGLVADSGPGDGSASSKPCDGRDRDAPLGGRRPF